MRSILSFPPENYSFRFLTIVWPLYSLQSTAAVVLCKLCDVSVGIFSKQVKNKPSLEVVSACHTESSHEYIHTTSTVNQPFGSTSPKNK